MFSFPTQNQEVVVIAAATLLLMSLFIIIIEIVQSLGLLATFFSRDSPIPVIFYVLDIFMFNT